MLTISKSSWVLISICQASLKSRKLAVLVESSISGAYHLLVSVVKAQLVHWATAINAKLLSSFLPLYNTSCLWVVFFCLFFTHAVCLNKGIKSFWLASQVLCFEKKHIKTQSILSEVTQHQSWFTSKLCWIAQRLWSKSLVCSPSR